MSKDKKSGRFPPFSLRLSFDERAKLESQAGSMALGAYIREKLLGDPEPRRKRREPVKDELALAQLLAAFGKSNLANNLNQIAKAVHSGSLDVTPDTERAMQPWLPPRVGLANARAMQAEGYHPACTEFFMKEGWGNSLRRLSIDPCGARGNTP